MIGQDAPEECAGEECEPEEMHAYPAQLAESPAEAVVLYERHRLTTIVSGDDTLRLERSAVQALKAAGQLPEYDRLWIDVVSGGPYANDQ